MAPNRPALHYAITSHGLGHLTRSLAVVQAIHTLDPDLELHLSTTVDRGWIERQLEFPVFCRSQSYEPGALQKNCFEVDIAATREGYRNFLTSRPARLREEIEFLRTRPFVGVVSDISALAVRAASEVGLPGIGVTNFTWDWILEPWCAEHPDEAIRRIPAVLSEDYRAGLVQLRLPYGPDETSFPALERAPLVARRARKTAAEVRSVLGIGDGPLAVVCPGGWGADEWPAIHAKPGDFSLITVGSLPVTSDAPLLDFGRDLPAGIAFPDLVEAADVILGKPGYGLASECATQQTPFAMIERPEFRETPYLVAEFAANGRCSTSTIEEFFSGQWEPMLLAALDGGSPWVDPPVDAARQVATRVMEICGV